jgi:hypothetical protein
MLSIYQEFETVIAKLELEQIPYALCGGLAVGLHTEPRATKDIDILLLANDVESVKKTLLTCGFKFFSTPMYGFTRMADLDENASKLAARSC